ncbi:MAG: hypothetical protein HY650_15305 [Acidobacteria bacterium]|nr:hypothetical protein [Acidobacteriota bacterium]
MKNCNPPRRKWLISGAFLIVLAVATLPTDRLMPAARAQNDVVSHPSPGGTAGEKIFTKLMERNVQRERRLRQYSVARTYSVKNDKGKLRASAQVVLQYQAPSTKVFNIVAEEGSGFVRRGVFKRLMESEVESAAGRSRHDSSITPANYSFEFVGEEDVDGHHCLVVQAIPKRRDKYLFDGRVWIEAHEFAIVRIEGHPAKNPSFWIKQVDFVRRYQKIGEFWLPLKDESVTQVRVFGKNILTIDYQNYEVVELNAMISSRASIWK